jgi:acetate kinase
MMRYAVPDSWHDAGVRRWGFHGASHRYIAERSAARLGGEARVISCHLGGSSSVAGIRGGVAIGNSLGMSPQSGIPQNNRVGDLDPAALPYVMRTLNLTLDEAERQLTRESGLLGLSGLSNDIRDLERAAAGGHARAALALDVFVTAVRHWIGVYFLELNGADALVFTAGIGEHSALLRERICANLDNLGIVLDPALNALAGTGERTLSATTSRTAILVMPANEELIVAREAHRLLTAPDDTRQRETTNHGAGRRAQAQDDARHSSVTH